MGTGKNRLLLGVIIMLIGLYALFRPSVEFSLSAVMFTVCGGAFLLLYYTKRKSWSLVLGGYLTYTGVMGFVQPHIPLNEAIDIVGTMFFIVPSIIFLVLYYDKNKRGLLMPAMLMLCFGVFLFSKDLQLFHGHGWLLFTLCMGAAFVLTFLLGRGYSRRSTLYFGCGVIIVGLLAFGGFSMLKTMLANMPQLIAVALILAAAVIIIHALRRR